MGVERIMFAADYPYMPADGGAARTFLEQGDVTEVQREAIASGIW